MMLTLVLKGVLMWCWFTIIDTMMVLLRIGLKSWFIRLTQPEK